MNSVYVYTIEVFEIFLNAQSFSEKEVRYIFEFSITKRRNAYRTYHITAKFYIGNNTSHHRQFYGIVKL